MTPDGMVVGANLLHARHRHNIGHLNTKRLVKRLSLPQRIERREQNAFLLDKATCHTQSISSLVFDP